MTLPQLQVGIKIWFEESTEEKEKLTIGFGDILLIQSIIECKNLTKAADQCNYSYKYAWNKLKNIENAIGNPIVETHRGGFGGGGSAEVTPWGVKLVTQFLEIKEKIEKIVSQISIQI